jgi:hypothetical protein
MAWSEKAIQAAKKALLATPCTFFEESSSDIAIGNAVCRALDAAAAVDGDAGWQSIDTAPLDTDVVLAWRVEWPEPMWKQQIGWAGKSNSCAKESGYSDAWFHGTATHWMPLPAPPSVP